MPLNLSTYFQNSGALALPELLDGVSTPAEILARAKTVLDTRLTAPDVRENRGEFRGSGPELHGNYFIGEGTVVYGGVTLIGPVYVGKNCEIMPGAILRPYTILSDGCSVGHGSELKRAVFFSGAKIASEACALDSVLGKSARIGSGAITSNRRFDESCVTLKAGGEKISLGDSFFGLILGDASRLGANCVTQPGTHIGHHTWIFPQTTVRGFIPPQKRVYDRAELVYEDNEIVELNP
ncbi:MAG: hypothetical protein LBC78_05205 [Oscillospiraceae bacterium]|jgi:NDP-sugar pyrophosphorylase family protein|nr:hypothetical protein [Oscillospiraceae bacterium]